MDAGRKSITVIYIIYTSILRGVGDSITPLIALGMTSILGLFITPVLIAGHFGFPRLGIIGPAIATTIGYLAVLIFLYFYLKKKDWFCQSFLQFFCIFLFLHYSLLCLILITITFLCIPMKMLGAFCFGELLYFFLIFFPTFVA